MTKCINVINDMILVFILLLIVIDLIESHHNTPQVLLLINVDVNEEELATELGRSGLESLQQRGSRCI
jgi:hypothetical protein